MHKISFLVTLAAVALTCAADAQQNGAPVYVNGWAAGVVACEFAENGTKGKEYADEMKSFIPFVQNGKLYFVGLGKPVINGNLKTGFEFFLSDKHTMKGAYKGNQNDYIDNRVIVLGYAEQGKITITNVFRDDSSAEVYVKEHNLKLAF